MVAGAAGSSGLDIHGGSLTWLAVETGCQVGPSVCLGCLTALWLGSESRYLKSIPRGRKQKLPGLLRAELTSLLLYSTGLCSCRPTQVQGEQVGGGRGVAAIFGKRKISVMVSS